MLKELIRKYYRSRWHKHTMIVQQYTEDTCEGKKKHSRSICKNCGWTDYDSYWTWHKKPNHLL